MQTEELIKVVAVIAPSLGQYLKEKLEGGKKVSVPEVNMFLLTKLIENGESHLGLMKQSLDILNQQNIILTSHIRHEESVLRELEACMRELRTSLEIMVKHQNG